MLIDFSYQEGAFDEAVKGIDAIEHTASPAHFNAVDPQGGCLVHISLHSSLIIESRVN
jgi:hypothetical protein